MAQNRDNKDSPSIVDHHHTFNGLDKWAGLTVCGLFATLVLLLIVLPAKHRRMVRWSLLMTLLAGPALLHTFLFKLEIDLSTVQISPAQMRLSDTTGHHAMQTVSDGATAEARSSGRRFVVFQDEHVSDSSPRLEQVDHRLTYRGGFYCALSVSITMLVLVVACLLALRNALAGWWLWKKVQIDSKGGKGFAPVGRPCVLRYRFTPQNGEHEAPASDVELVRKRWGHSHADAAGWYSDRSWQITGNVSKMSLKRWNSGAALQTTLIAIGSLSLHPYENSDSKCPGRPA